MTEPNIRHDLNYRYDDSDYDHWLEIYKSDNGIKAVKKDSKPVYNEDTYYYSDDGDPNTGLEFESGKHSCSGAGKYRSTSPSDWLDQKIRELANPLTAGV